MPGAESSLDCGCFRRVGLHALPAAQLGRGWLSRIGSHSDSPVSCSCMQRRSASSVHMRKNRCCRTWNAITSRRTMTNPRNASPTRSRYAVGCSHPRNPKISNRFQATPYLARSSFLYRSRAILAGRGDKSTLLVLVAQTRADAATNLIHKGRQTSPLLAVKKTTPQSELHASVIPT